MKKLILKLITIIIRIVIALIVGFVLLILYLTVKEYRPADRVALDIRQGEASEASALLPGDAITAVTWNVGYGALGDNADFFMDYGKMVYTADEERLNQNLAGISETLNEITPDIILLQETDEDSSRSYHLNENDYFAEEFQEFDSTFAYNFKVDYIPYPIPPIGKVTGGLMTLSRFRVNSAERIQLPCPFTWPTRVANLKRCLSVNRIPVEGSDKELVIVNLHLEAYDDGEGKAAQTKILAEFLQAEAEAGNYVIAGGDFNQAFSGTDTSAYPEIPDKWHCGLLDEEAFGDLLVFCQDPSSPTCRALDQPYEGSDIDNFQYYVIDGFIVSSNLKVQSVETLDLQFRDTDHNPVVIKVIIPE